ncbi:MAG TPA: TadE family type IV pilus minor pilin [Acidimicrobiales bacterium]|nr:TadE family type IV pilus minor pilin [Acidimicrobiales bacterium]
MSRRGRRTGRGVDPGQTTVELALVLPLVVVVLLVVVQVGLVVRDQVLVVHAAREAARAAAVGDTDAQVQQATARAGPLSPTRLHVSVVRRGGPGGDVDVHVRYRCVTDLPLVGVLVPDLDLRASVVMRQE